MSWYIATFDQTEKAACHSPVKFFILISHEHSWNTAIISALLPVSKRIMKKKAPVYGSLQIFKGQSYQGREGIALNDKRKDDCKL